MPVPTASRLASQPDEAFDPNSKVRELIDNCWDFAGELLHLRGDVCSTCILRCL